MGKVIVGITMSLDGFINDRNGDVDRLYPDLEELHDTQWLKESIKTTGAVVMGRHAYEMSEGDFTGYEYQVPIFVVTHFAPEKVAKGENGKLRFIFVTDGVESALRKAMAAAGDKDVTVIGGANTAQQCLRCGLVDELQIGIMPWLLGTGLRFFDSSSLEQMQLERIGIYETPTRLDIRYRIVK